MKIAPIILSFLAASLCAAQIRVDTVYRVELTVTASPMVSLFRNPSIPGTHDKASLGGGIFARAMWHPGRLLSIGLITGYTFIDQNEIPAAFGNYTARLTAIPVQIAISMQKRDFEIGVGLGPYIVMTNIEGGGSPAAHGSRLELGMTYFGTYQFALSDRIRVGPELRVLDLRYRGILSIMPSLSVRFDAVRY